jgi:hypothetical protein
MTQTNPLDGSVASIAQGGTGGTTLANLSLTSSLSTVQPPITKSTLPAVTYSGNVSNPTSGSSISGAQTINGVITGTTVPNPIFGTYGGANLGPRSPAVVQANVLENLAYNTGYYSLPNLTVEFYHSGSQLDIIAFCVGQYTTVYVDDQYLDTWSAYEQAGTAQAGGANTITLSSGASATNGIYNTCYVTILSGTGAGQTKQITGYVGSTKVATVASNWSTQPDNTSVYRVVDSSTGLSTNANSGEFDLFNLNFGSVATRKITIVTGAFYGVNIGPNDTVWPAPPTGSLRMVIVGDSLIANTGAPMNNPYMSTQLARLCGFQEVQCGAGGSGWVATNNNLNFLDRIAPPNEAFNINLNTTNGTNPSGTFTVSVTYGGSTQTTGNITWSSTPATLSSAVQTAINALSNVPSNNAVVADSDFPARPIRVILHNMPGATLTINTSGMSGTGFTSSVTNYPGEVAPNVPKDGSGNALPFVLYVQGSLNDISYSASQVQTNATAAAQAIVKNFPTAIAIFSGPVSVSTSADTGVIGTFDLEYTSAIQAAAAYLTPINGNVPFINPWSAGSGGNAWIFGSGTVASPTTDKNDVLISALVASHPTGNGHSYLAARLAQGIKTLLGAQ